MINIDLFHGVLIDLHTKRPNTRANNPCRQGTLVTGRRRIKTIVFNGKGNKWVANNGPEPPLTSDVDHTKIRLSDYKKQRQREREWEGGRGRGRGRGRVRGR